MNTRERRAVVEVSGRVFKWFSPPGPMGGSLRVSAAVMGERKQERAPGRQFLRFRKTAQSSGQPTLRRARSWTCSLRRIQQAPDRQGSGQALSCVATGKKVGTPWYTGASMPRATSRRQKAKATAAFRRRGFCFFCEGLEPGPENRSLIKAGLTQWRPGTGAPQWRAEMKVTNRERMFAARLRGPQNVLLQELRRKRLFQRAKGPPEWKSPWPEAERMRGHRRLGSQEKARIHDKGFYCAECFLFFFFFVTSWRPTACCCTLPRWPFAIRNLAHCGTRQRFFKGSDRLSDGQAKLGGRRFPWGPRDMQNSSLPKPLSSVAGNGC